MTTAEGNAKLDFIKTCGNFCIVNPSKNQMLSLKSCRKKELEKFEYVLDKYKKWLRRNLMQYFIATLLMLLVIGMGVSSCNSKKAHEAQKTAIETSSVESSIPEFPGLTDMVGIDYSVKSLLDSTVAYLKTKSEYKDLYTDKKFVIYYIGADCPYAQAFISAIDPLTTDSTYTEKYNFYPQSASGMKKFASMEDAQADIDFSNTCQEFCIVNPKTNQVFSINGIGDKEAEKIPDILKQLLDW